MEILNKLLMMSTIVLPALIAFNVILGGVGQFLHAINQAKAESIVGKLAGYLKKLIDLVQGNMAH